MGMGRKPLQFPLVLLANPYFVFCFHNLINMKKNLVFRKYCASLNLKRIAVLCLFISLSTLSLITQRGFSQGMVVSPKNSDICDGVTWHCCQFFRYTAPAGGVDEIDIGCGTNNGTNPSPNCWNWGCNTHWVSNQAGIGVTVTVNPGGGWKITFSPKLAAGNTFTIELCPNNGQDACAYSWLTFNWVAKLLGAQVDPPTPPFGPGSVNINGCSGGQTGYNTNSYCPGCDRIDLYQNTPCDERVCITRHWPAVSSTGTTFIVTFSPPLQPCNFSTTGCLEEYTLTGPTLDPDEVSDGWSLTDVSPPGVTGQNYKIQGPGLDGCFSICFDIPACDPLLSHTVWVNNPNDPDSCAESIASASFKTAANPSSGNTIVRQYVSNFPNPVTSASQFKTTIPFETSSEGIAKISVFDPSGKVIYTDAQDFVGIGKHFFYFTGEQLPSGKYFYTIESPLGVTIIKQSLLIVK
jgi:hypothetical protein